jgi:sulfide:quinone oxidoreductase
VSNLFEENEIKTLPFFSVESVDPSARKVHSLEGDEYDYDLLITVPPHRGARVVRESGLGDDYGWIRADKRTMTVDGHDDAFGIGDATNIPTYKLGVVAYLESRVVAANIAAAVEGRESEFEYDGRINFPVEVGNRRAIFVSATYQKPPSDQSPSVLKYAMKRSFDALYWSAVSGRREWMMKVMLGPIGEKVPKAVQQSAPQT